MKRPECRTWVVARWPAWSADGPGAGGVEVRHVGLSRHPNAIRELVQEGRETHNFAVARDDQAVQLQCPRFHSGLDLTGEVVQSNLEVGDTTLRASLRSLGLLDIVG